MGGLEVVPDVVEDRRVDVPLVVAEVGLPAARERVEVDPLGLLDALAPALPREHRTTEPCLMGGRPGLAHPAVAVHQQPARDLGQPDVEERERVDLVPEHVPAIGLAVESAGGHPGVEVGGVTGADLQDVRDVQPQQQLHALVSRHPHVAYPPQLVPCRGVALERSGEVGVAGRRLGRLDQRVADRRIPRRVERHHLLDPRRRALLHVEGEDLLDIVLHLIQPPLDLEGLIAANTRVRAAWLMYRFDCRVSAFSAMTSGPNVRGETGFRWRPSSCW